MIQSGWDDKAFEIAKQMHADGCSHGVISYNLFKLGYDLSRNAVIGKLNRNGLTGLVSIKKRQVLPRPPVERVYIKKTPLPEPKAELLIAYIGPVASFPPKGCCQYTRDDPKNPSWQMCGHPVRNLESRWCADHAAICFQPKHKSAAG